jgi:4-hydroxybenzoate polyprenyltransferase
LIIVGALLAYLYSAAPFRFKSIPFMDLVVNSTGFSILFLIGYCSLKPLDKSSLLIAILFFLLFIPLQIIHELAHFEKDKSEKAITTVVRYGIPVSLKLFFISLLPFAVWPLFLWYLRVLPIYAFQLSVLFSAYISLRFSKILKNCASINMNDLRIHVRFLTIFYGLCMLFILIKSNKM